jgi:endopeptidase Clp ATP-binding regulatory subunit ClpX
MRLKMAGKIPSPMELQKEIADFLKQKYGDQMPGIPEPAIYKTASAADEPKPGKPLIRFDLKPEELEAYLKKNVVNQEEAIAVLSTKICTHFNRMNLDFEENSDGIIGNIKSNVLMIGPTGVGKTYIVKLIAQKIGVPFVKGDATKFSETGYVGGDVEDLIRELVREANGDLQLAQYGIVYLDEIDKIASSQNSYGPDVSRTGVQRNLLKLMEESEVELRPPHDLAAQMEAMMEAQRSGKIERKKVNTRNILFVVSGAFNGLEEIIRKRLKKQAIGFDPDKEFREQEAVDYLMHAKSQDLIEFGFESEFVGRLPVSVRLNELDTDALHAILRNPDSAIVRSKKRDFQAYGIEIDFEDEALRLLAEKAFNERTGARGLVSVFEKILLKYEKKLPSSQIRKFTLTAEMVRNPENGLKLLLNTASMKQFQKKFLAGTGIVIRFTPGALRRVTELAEKENTDFFTKAQEIFSNYEYGLKLLKLTEFVVDEGIINDPQGELEKLIKQTYKR